MKVRVIGKTQATLLTETDCQMPGEAGGSKFNHAYNSGERQFGHGQVLIEFAGRLCYESWSLPNEATASNSGYVRNIVSQAHESVLEHVSVTFYVEGVSRNLSHELIRHRHLSFSELSQRFVNMSESNFVTPPAMTPEGADPLYPMGDTSEIEEYEETVYILEQKGKTRKQAREAARYWLPAGMETKFVVTGNLRAWRDVLKKRDSEHADAEMQLFAKEIKRQLLIEYPDVFADLEEW